MPKTIAFILFIGLATFPLSAQEYPQLNTAYQADYLSDNEKEMIYELNLVRCKPEVYIKLLKPYLKRAEANLEIHGPGPKSYSVTKHYETFNGKKSITKIDTSWMRSYEEEVAAIKGLIKDLENLEPMPLLYPDKGIYQAAKKHGRDQNRNNWKLGHYGSDGSSPYDRISRYASQIADGNENIAGRFPEPTSREVVVMLLIDSGIQGYGHRYNILNPKWTHVACYEGGLHNGMYRWLQEFASKH